MRQTARKNLIRNTLIGATAAFALAVPVTLPALTPGAAPVAAAASGNLRVGSEGATVTAVQQLLVASGAGIEVDGKFGPATEQAVINFQASQGLATDGIVGPDTIAELAPTIKDGSRGNAVAAAQTLLGVESDGVFGPNTEAATRAFQEKSGLGVDGIIGPKTWTALLTGTAPPSDDGGSTPRPGEPGTYAGESLSAEQVGNARTIIAVAKGYGFNEDAQVIALMTAMQESTLTNVRYGDRDSQGLFQQRPSMGWGTVSQVTDPVLATRAFLGVADHTSNPGLQDVDGWESMRKTEAAQSVQRSAYPDAYAKWEDMATQLVEVNGDVDPLT